MKSIIPLDITAQGFVFNQIEMPSEIIEEVLKFPFDYCYHEDHEEVKYGVYDVGHSSCLTNLLPWDMKEYNLNWQAKEHSPGFYLHPHRAYYVDNLEYQGPVMALMWVCPDEYSGREYVYGEFSDVNFAQKIFPWDYPGLVEKGRIKPKTGTVCLMDRMHYKWWHGVSKQETGKVITLIAELKNA